MSGPTRHGPMNVSCPALDEVLAALLLCAGQEMKTVPPDGTLQCLQDGCSVVTGALDEEGLAVAPEADGARTGPRSELPCGCLEAWGGLKAEALRIRDGAEYQVAGQL